MYEKNIKLLKQFKSLFIIKTDEKEPEKATCRIHSSYLFITSEIEEKRKILYKYSKFFIKNGKQSLFIVRLPESSKRKFQLRSFLAEAEIHMYSYIKISSESIIIKRLAEKGIPKFWSDRIPKMKEELKTVPDYIRYYPQEKPSFPLFLFGSGIESNINYYGSMPAYTCFLMALQSHILLTTGILNQKTIQKVVARTTDIRKLLPKQLTLKKLFNGFNTIEKGFFGSKTKIKHMKKCIEFTYNTDVFLRLKFQEKRKNGKSKTIRRQQLQIPFTLLKEVFKNEAFGKNGFRYFLCVAYGWHCFSLPKVQYKISTLIKYGNIETKRGIKYTLQALNRPLQFLKTKGYIKSVPLITEEDLKEDRAIEIWLTPLQQLNKAVTTGESIKKQKISFPFEDEETFEENEDLEEDEEEEDIFDEEENIEDNEDLEEDEF